MRELTYSEAIKEATEQLMEQDPSVYTIGLGVPDPKGIFGTTSGLQEKYGSHRVFDMPVAENGMTGIAISSALGGLRPIMTHQRVDFALMAMDQMINNAAKWHYMFGGKASVPITWRLLVERGWGQGPQHSQSLQALFSHIPGLKVLMPTTPMDEKGLLISSVQDDNPTLLLEHRWLYNTKGDVPSQFYSIPIGKANVMKEGKDITVVTSSYMTLEALKAFDFLREQGIHLEVIDLRSIKPLDIETIERSVKKTGHLLVADGAWKTGSIANDVIASIVENQSISLKSAPQRVCFPDVPTPTSWVLAKKFYPRAYDIVKTALKMLKNNSVKNIEKLEAFSIFTGDVPDPSFTGPF